VPARCLRSSGGRGFEPSIRRSKKRRTTVPDEKAPPAPDLVERRFEASRRNELWRRTAGSLALTAEEEADDGSREASSLGCASEHARRKEPDVAGKKRSKSLVQTEKKAPAKPKRPKKTSRGK
jgi:hypothetical protein